MNKHLRNFLSLLLLLSLVCTLILPVFGAEAEETPEETEEAAPARTLTISSMEDFLQFSEDCVRDIYSRDLVVTLKTDLDFTGREFKAVPSFSGTFEGNHHTIKGITLETEGSYQGLFRYLTDTALVKDLTVMAEIHPEGSRNQIGGIAGSNAGIIRSCRFEGSVSGTESVGGIAGLNRISGIIEDCTVSGRIRGAHFGGGLVGENYGTIRRCKNMASVNIREEDNKIDSVSFDPEFIMGKEAIDTATDLGGIAGVSSGVIRDCFNHGQVGYPHMGYNVGGIAGSQKGYIVGCRNYGEINGRKEIAGIAGQLEPVTFITYTEDTLQILRRQLDNTSGLANRAAANISGTSQTLGGDIATLREQAHTAIDAVQELLPSDGEFPDWDTVVSANNALAGSIGSMQGTISDINDSAQAVVGTAAGDIRAITNSVREISDTLDNAADHLGGTITDISDLDTPEDLGAKIQDCQNSGPIFGDLNVGGIAGAVAWENDKDPEDDYTVSGDRSLSFDSQFRAVILNSGNAGKIQAKKRNAGGIAGNLSLGLIRDSMNTGFVEGENADYLGGIAGTSQGFIRSCNVKTRLTGHSYIGGIAGSGTIISDCRSTTMISSEAEKLGSILGVQVESDGEEELPVSGNFYVPLEEHLGAIDGIDYYEMADSLSRQEFLDLPGLSSIFLSSTMTFQYPDGSSQRIVVPLGEEVDPEKIPEPPRKEGYISTWEGLDDLDLGHMFFNVTLKPEFTASNQVAVSDRTRWDGKPVLLAEGYFGDIETLKVTESTEKPDSHEVQEVWNLPDFGTDEKTLVHLTVPEGMDPDSGRVLVLKADGSWEQVEAKADGTYLVFEAEPSDRAAAIYESHRKEISAIISISGGVLLVVLILVTVLVLKKRKKKKQASNQKKA